MTRDTDLTEFTLTTFALVLLLLFDLFWHCKQVKVIFSSSRKGMEACFCHRV